MINIDRKPELIQHNQDFLYTNSFATDFHKIGFVDDQSEDNAFAAWRVSFDGANAINNYFSG